MIHARIREAQQRLVSSGIAEPEAAIDAELLARHILGWSREQMVTRWLDASPADGIPADFESRYRALVDRRLAREPVAYIIGHREFWGLDFEVTRDVLIPRPETELIVEESLALITSGTLTGNLTIVDVGTGSGVIALSLAAKFPKAKILAVDVSDEALSLAQENAARLNLSGRVRFHKSHLLENVGEPFDLIVANLPYISTQDRHMLSREVLHDPEVALFAGVHGYELVRGLIDQAPSRLRPGGMLALEIGLDQSDRLLSAMTEKKYRDICSKTDYNGVKRFLFGRYG